MSQKRNDILGQTLPSHDQSNVNYNKGSTLELCRSHGIPSKNTANEKLGQTAIMFTNRANPHVDDDSLETSIRYLKFNRFNQ